MSVPDRHATIVQPLGPYHDQIFHDQDGLEEKLTGVEGAQVVKGVVP